MSTRSIEQVVEQWLEDGPNDLPDWVVDDAFARARTVPQVRRRPALRPSRWTAWGRPRVMAVGAAAAVALAVAFGFSRIGPQPGVGGPDDTPPASASPSSSVPPSPSGSGRAGPVDPAGLPSAGEVIAEYDTLGGDWFAATDDAVWLPQVAEGTVIRVDAATGEVVATIETGEADDPNALTVAPDGMVWVTRSQTGGVVRIDPATNEVAEVIETGDFKPYALAHDGQRLWLTDFGATSQVGFIDPATGELTLVEGTAGGRPTGITVGGGYVWVAEQLGMLLQIDARTGEKVARIRMPAAGLSVAWAFDSAWMEHRLMPAVTRVGTDGQLIATMLLGGEAAFNLAAGESVLWATTGPHPDKGCEAGPNYLLAIDPATNAPTAATELPCAWAVAETDDGVWVLGDKLYLVDPAG